MPGNVPPCSLAMITTDFSNTITEHNDAFARMLGYEGGQELVMRSFHELGASMGSHICSTGERITIDEGYRREQIQYVNRLLQAGTASTRIYLRRKDGIVVPADATASLLTDTNGQRTGILTIFVDATARIGAEQQKKETNLFLEVFSAARDGIYVSDGIGKCIMANQAFCEMTGYTQQELIGSQGASLLPDSIDAMINEQTVQAMSTDSDMLFFRTMWRHKNGGIFPVEVNLAVLKNAQDQDNGIVATVRDITERQKAESEALSEKAFFENVFINVSEGMYVTDEVGCLIMVNQSFCDLTGYTRDELIGRYVPDMLPFDSRYTSEELTKLSSAEDLSCFEARWRKKDGTVFMAEIRLAEIKNSKDAVSGFVGVVCDTTARKHIERELEARILERTASLEEMNKALTVLLRVRDEDRQAFLEKITASISGMVLPYIDRLKTTCLDERQRASIVIIEANLKDLIAPFTPNTAAKLQSLTPAELQIANLIRQGHKTKDIAQLTGLSTRTIDHARESIRTKLGIEDRKISLSAFLLSSFSNSKI